jgi:hypothetical protein
MYNITAFLINSSWYMSISFKRVISEKIVHLIWREVSIASQYKCIHIRFLKKGGHINLDDFFSVVCTGFH